MAGGSKKADNPKHLLPLAWGGFGALIAGVLIWLSGAADQTVADLQARADRTNLRISAELPDPPAPVVAEPAEEPDPQPEETEVADAEEEAAEEPQEPVATAGADLPPAPDETVELTEPEAPEASAELAEEVETAAVPEEAVEEEPPAIEEAVDGDVPPWLAHARPFDNPDNLPRIAIVVTDMGLSAAATQLAIQDLPGEITLAFAAHAQDLATWIPQSRAAGHESLVMVPMEPEDYPVNDPGPYTLLTNQAASTNVDRLDWSLRRASGFVGVLDTKGSRFTSVGEAVQPIVAELGDRGFMVLDSGSNEESVLPAIAREENVPVSTSNTFITDFASGDAIDLRLNELEAIARDRGSAVGLAFPYPIMFDRLKAWIATLEEKELTLAPITAVAVQSN